MSEQRSSCVSFSKIKRDISRDNRAKTSSDFAVGSLAGLLNIDLGKVEAVVNRDMNLSQERTVEHGDIVGMTEKLGKGPPTYVDKRIPMAGLYNDHNYLSSPITRELVGPHHVFSIISWASETNLAKRTWAAIRPWLSENSVGMSGVSDLVPSHGSRKERLDQIR